MDVNFNKQKYIVGLGEVLWDIYPDGRYLGGALYNIVHHTVQLGYRGILISRVGNDSAGNELIKILKQKGIDTRFIQIDSCNETGYVTVILDQNKVPSFVCSQTVTCDFLEWDERFYELIPQIDAVVFGTFAQRTPQSAAVTEQFLKECPNAVKVFDVNFRGWNQQIITVLWNCLPLTNILKMNEQELRRIRIVWNNLSENIPDALQGLVHQFGLKLACLTTGEYGCIMANETEIVYCPAIRVQPVDTTGAGDAFVAALTIKYLEKAPLSAIGAYANQIAGYTITRMGASPDYSEGDVLTCMRQTGMQYIVYDDWRKYMVI